MTLTQLNQLSSAEATNAFMLCCTSEIWVENMVNARPYSNESELTEKANLAWKNLAEHDYLQAFDGHPQIGDVNSLRAKYANTKALASGEQSAVNIATDDTLAKLSAANSAYLTKFGFIFIVCATGKSAEQMLMLLNERLPNNRATELINAAEEQRKILQLRIIKLLSVNDVNSNEKGIE